MNNSTARGLLEHSIEERPSDDAIATPATSVSLTDTVSRFNKWCEPRYEPIPPPGLFPQRPEAWQGRDSEGPSAAEIATSYSALQEFQVCSVCSQHVVHIFLPFRSKRGMIRSTRQLQRKRLAVGYMRIPIVRRSLTSDECNADFCLDLRRLYFRRAPRDRSSPMNQLRPPTDVVAGINLWDPEHASGRRPPAGYVLVATYHTHPVGFHH